MLSNLACNICLLNVLLICTRTYIFQIFSILISYDQKCHPYLATCAAPSCRAKVKQKMFLRLNRFFIPELELLIRPSRSKRGGSQVRRQSCRGTEGGRGFAQVTVALCCCSGCFFCFVFCFFLQVTCGVKQAFFVTFCM